MSKSTCIYLLTLLLLMAAPQALAQEKQECRLYHEIAESIVPSEVGNASFIQKLVSVPDGVDFLAQFPNLCPPPKEISKQALHLCFCETRNLTLRYNKNKGELKFVDRDHLFNLEKSSLKAVNEQEGLRAIFPFFTIIGNIFTEANFATYQTNVLMGSGAFQEETKPSFTFEAERHYRVGRMINGIPVEESRFFAAVSNEGWVSKFRMRWPQFKIEPAVKEKAEPVFRELVVQNVYEAMVERIPTCQELSIYDAYIAYTPYSKDKVEDNDDVLYEESQEVVFIPQLVVTLLPESGTEGGAEFVVDLIEPGNDSQ